MRVNVPTDGGGAALSWFKDHFLRCNDRAALVKTWLPAQYAGPSTWVDELVYNRALTLVRISHHPFFPRSHQNDLRFSSQPQSRTAARKELLDQHKAPDECERLYEESLWCLYALQDDLLQKGNPFMEEDRETIATCALLFPLEFGDHLAEGLGNRD
jgi:serine/threonine-protein kinase ULK/ATG1